MLPADCMFILNCVFGFAFSELAMLLLYQRLSFRSTISNCNHHHGAAQQLIMMNVFANVLLGADWWQIIADILSALIDCSTGSRSSLVNS